MKYHTSTTDPTCKLTLIAAMATPHLLNAIKKEQRVAREKAIERISALIANRHHDHDPGHTLMRISLVDPIDYAGIEYLSLIREAARRDLTVAEL